MNMGKSLRQIDDELPNGFHDALLRAVTLDLVSNSASLRLHLFVGEPDAASEEAREAYRGATLTLEELMYFVIDVPDRWDVRPGGRVMIDAGDATDHSNPRAPTERSALPAGAFAYWIFVHEWNCFIHVAARGAVLQWE